MLTQSICSFLMSNFYVYSLPQLPLTTFTNRQLINYLKRSNNNINILIIIPIYLYLRLTLAISS